jgi:serine/threonine-protein kinase RsbT
MDALKAETHEIRSSEDVVHIRQAVRKYAVEQGFNLVDQTKIVTASSELARNTFLHGGGGTAIVEAVRNGSRSGVRVTFADEGPGIASISQAMTDGFTSGGGLGLGLGGAKRLSHEFAIESQSGRGTRVTILRWKG